MLVEERVPIVGKFRWCPRCAAWRAIGNFSVSRSRGKLRLGKKCHVCWRAGGPHGARKGYVLTDLGRAALAEMRAESVA